MTTRLGGCVRLALGRAVHVCCALLACVGMSVQIIALTSGPIGAVRYNSVSFLVFFGFSLGPSRFVGFPPFRRGRACLCRKW